MDNTQSSPKDGGSKSTEEFKPGLVKLEKTVEETITTSENTGAVLVDQTKLESTNATKVEDDDDLEEGELKDDDDDDDDDGDLDANKKGSQSSSDDDSDSKNGKRSSSSSRSSVSAKSDKSSSSKKSVKSGTSRTGKSKRASDNEADMEPGKKNKGSSVKSSSSDDNKNGSYHRSSSSRHGSSSRQSPHSYLSFSSRRRSSPVSSQQARLVSMRAKLLEARFREIEMRTQKGKSSNQTSMSKISSISTPPVRNLKTTIAKPSITYAENPNPIDIVAPLEPTESPKKKAKKHKKSERKSSSSKRSKKRKKKSSDKRRKIIKTSDSSKKSSSSHEAKSLDTKVPFDDEIADRQGPRTPPDNLVFTVEKEQIEWPSYLIKMTITQPSISYSVNPNSVSGKNLSLTPDTADLNSDFIWYCNYFVNSCEMDKAQANHQAYTTMISTGNYDDEKLSKWLEKRGISKQSADDKETYPHIPRDDESKEDEKNARLPFRPVKPKCTILKSQREVVLPNGKILPAGTIQKIVHPYPRTERVVPEMTGTFNDLF